MERPKNCPVEVWEDATEKERRCIVSGHNWYYDTCERCGARQTVPDHLSRKHDEQRCYERKVEKLAGGR